MSRTGWDRVRKTVLAVVVLCIGLVPLAIGCSPGGDEVDAGASSVTGTVPPGGSTGLPDGAPDTSATAGPCPEGTTLTLVDSDGTTRRVDVVTEFADVTLGDTADLVFASYEIPEDPQFGVSAPVGDPQAPVGGTIVQFTLFGGDNDAFPTGTYVEDDAATPRIMFAAAYDGPTRINPLGDHTIEITEVTTDHLCGTITGIGDTGLQTLPYVEGDFLIPVA